MKRMVSSYLSALLLGSVVLGHTAPAKAEGQATERVIVVFKDKANENLIKAARGKVKKGFKQTPALAVEVPSAALQGLKNHPDVLSVEPDVKVKVAAQTQDWGIATTNAQQAWNSGLTGKGVKVAVVDTGISTHEDLQIAGGASLVSYTSSYSDDNGHGTHVAGIVGALNNEIGSVGIAPESSLFAVKVLDNNGSGYLSDVIAGIDWSITNKMDVINLSLGSNTDSTALHSVVDKAYQNNIVVVAAAGNDGTSDGSGDTVDYPARYSSAVAVGAIDSANNRAYFSSTGPAVAVSAPGVSVLSTSNTNGYVRMSGTSMATPYVAGNVALIKQQNPTLSASELRNLLQQKVKDLGVAGKDAWYGYGLIQAPVAQTTTEPAPAPAPTPTPTPAPEPTPVVAKETITAVSTSKTTYLAKETVLITVKVTDKSGALLPDAKVALSLTDPKGRVLQGEGTTDSQGTVTFALYTSKKSTKGVYQVTAKTTKTDYTSSAGTTSFKLR